MKNSLYFFLPGYLKAQYKGFTHEFGLVGFRVSRGTLFRGPRVPSRVPLRVP